MNRLVSSLANVSAEVKLKYRHCTPCWIVRLERGRRALYYNPRRNGTPVEDLEEIV